RAAPIKSNSCGCRGGTQQAAPVKGDVHGGAGGNRSRADVKDAVRGDGEDRTGRDRSAVSVINGHRVSSRSCRGAIRAIEPGDGEGETRRSLRARLTLVCK